MQTLKVDLLLEHPRQREFFTPLEGQDWAKFVQDISERGILQALIVSDRDGHLTVCDGHQRLRAARELEWDDVPVSIQSFSSELEEVRCLVMNNVRRRQLSKAEMESVIGLWLRTYTHWANNRIAEDLGVSDMTIAKKRAEMESTSQIRKFDKLEGADGKYRPRSQPRATPQPTQLLDTRTGELIPEAALERVEVEYVAPFETRTVTLETPAGESQTSKTLRKALYLLCEISESDLRQMLHYEPNMGQMARDILEKLEGALEVKSTGLRTITVEAKAVN